MLLPGETWRRTKGTFWRRVCERRCGRGWWFAIGRLGGYGGVTLQRQCDVRRQLLRRPCTCLAVLKRCILPSLSVLHLPISSDRKALKDSKYLIHMRIITLDRQYPIGRIGLLADRGNLSQSLKSHMHARQQIHSRQHICTTLLVLPHIQDLTLGRMSGYGSPIRGAHRMR